MMADGQVTLGATVVKGTANKIRRLGIEGQILAGFAGMAILHSSLILSRFHCRRFFSL